MPQERIYTDQCPKPIMGFQDLHQQLLETIPYNIKILPFPLFINPFHYWSSQEQPTGNVTLFLERPKAAKQAETIFETVLPLSGDICLPFVLITSDKENSNESKFYGVRHRF